MNWKKVSILCDDIDIITNRLYMMDIYEFEITQSIEAVRAQLMKNKNDWDFFDEEKIKELLGKQRITIYLDENDTKTFQAIKNEFIKDKYVKEIFFDELEDNDWVNSWKKHFAPIDVSDNLVVVPCWQRDYKTDKRIIYINPGMIFGTGSHETTRLCLLEIEKHIKRDDSVLDLGCGSGILGICAKLLGASFVQCVDIAQNAIDVVKENAEYNDVFDIKINVGNIIEDEGLKNDLCKRKYNFVVANIVSDVIIAILPLVKDCLYDDGIFVCSGVIDGRQDDVRLWLIKSGFKIITEQSEDKWTAFTVCK